jgi:anti-sigma regulatory factor (Ser/Thr protein kinase)
MAEVSGNASAELCDACAVRLREREHRIASALQRAFLAGFLPVVDGLEFDSAYRPAATRATPGGDWYDAYQIADGRIALSVGDVMGHGLDAATTMVRVRETLRAATSACPGRTDLVLERTNRAVLAGGECTLVTALAGILDRDGSRFVYSCAGHPPPLLRRGLVARFLRGGGVPLGADAHPTFTVNEVKLEPDDLLLLYTDGLLEATQDIFEGERRLQIAIMRSSVTARSLVDEVAGTAHRDDVVALLIRLTAGRQEGNLPLALRGWEFSSDDAGAAETARSSFASYLRARGAREEDVLPCEMAFGELVGNVVRHAPGPIEIELEWSPPRPILRVRDYGPGFEITQTALPADVMSEGGRGLFLVEALGGKLHFIRRTMGGMTVVAELPVSLT